MITAPNFLKTLMWMFSVFWLLIVVVVILQFQSENLQTVQIRTLIGDMSGISLGNALLGALVIGFSVGLMIGGFFWQLKVLEVRWLRRKLKPKPVPTQQISTLQLPEIKEA